MSAGRLGERGLARLRRDLSARDLGIIGHVGDLRLMSVGQIEALCFPSEAHKSALSARRVCRRVLERLTRDHLLVRVERRIGGVSAGSAGYVYALGPVGARLLSAGSGRRHFREPSGAFVDHTLAIAQLAVDLTVSARSGAFDVVELQAEPRCWRQMSNLGGRTVLRPDLFVSLGIGELEHRLFIEVDRGSEHLPTLVRKCQLYTAYYRTGREQDAHGVFPRVCWVLPNERRAQQLTRVLDRSAHLVDGLFRITTTERALGELSEGKV